jgi:Ca2+-binding RTX toxin-like protein
VKKSAPRSTEGGEVYVRRITLLMVAMALAFTLAAGVALAQTVGDQGGQGVTKTCNTHCVGTQYPDTLKGTNNNNFIKGYGTQESPNWGDLIQGHGGNDSLHGDKGGDRVEGGNGADTVNGDAGNDALIGGTGNDHINAGSGSDSITAGDGYKDVINCGTSVNDELVSYDPGLDVFVNCERR